MTPTTIAETQQADAEERHALSEEPHIIEEPSQESAAGSIARQPLPQIKAQ